jgi:hypothetical protein
MFFKKGAYILPQHVEEDLCVLLFFFRNDKGQVAQMLNIQDGRVTAAKKTK